MRSLVILCCLFVVYQLPTSYSADAVAVDNLVPVDPCPPIVCQDPCFVSSGDNGCDTCVCPVYDDCRSSGCNADESCDTSDPNNLAASFKCFPISLKLCCPPPKMPNVCYNQNYCQHCNLYGWTIWCRYPYLSCPDWFGCYQCVPGVPCKWWLDPIYSPLKK